MFSVKISLIALLAFTGIARAQVNTLEYESGPTSKLEYTDGPSSKLTTEDIKELKAYAFNVNTSIDRLYKKTIRIEENPSSSDENSLVYRKEELKKGIEQLIADSQDKRSLLLLTHALKAGMIIVKYIDQEVIAAGTEQAPQGTVDQQIRIMKQSLLFAQEYYTSEFLFINGVLTTHEETTNPKFVEFGVKLTQFVLKMSNGITNARANYGMIRWSLAVLANYIRKDKNIGIAFASTQVNLMNTLSEKNADESYKFPDLVNGEAAPQDIECIMKTRDLKYLAKSSFEEISKMNKAITQ